ncbi:MAG: hypothetical protein Q8O31_00885, partial [Rhodocyclaceae bacterium]|nr:hypothetical protein [Rhodocyclaceae bacterium]
LPLKGRETVMSAIWHVTHYKPHRAVSIPFKGREAATAASITHYKPHRAENSHDAPLIVLIAFPLACP